MHKKYMITVKWVQIICHLHPTRYILLILQIFRLLKEIFYFISLSWLAPRSDAEGWLL